MSPTSPTPSTGMEFEYHSETMAQRRFRSSDETAAEEAKYYCLDPPRLQSRVRHDADSHSFAEAVRRSPLPGTSTASTIKRSTGVSNLPVLTSNPDAAPEQAVADNNKTAATAKKNLSRYPPLVVEKLPNWATHFRAIAAKLGRPPNARPFGSGVRFSPKSEDEYRVVQRYLVALEKVEGISWFTYSLLADKKTKVKIRGLPADTEPQEIEEELRSLGYEPEYVRHINTRQGRPGCVFALLNNTQDVRQKYDNSVFMNMRGVKIEAWRDKVGPTQCYRCQKFSHSSQQCHRPLACVRCGEGHAARDCPRPLNEPATCANCGGPHPACNNKCPVFQKEIKHKRSGTVAITAAPSRRTQTVPIQESEQLNEESQDASLMAAANGPTNRGRATASGWRKKKRGGRGRKRNPPAAQEATIEATPVPTKAQATTQKGAIAGAGIAQGKRTPLPRATTKSTDRSAGATPNKEFTACAIQLLMDLIMAIREGQDAEQIILDGLAALLTLYHGEVAEDDPLERPRP